MNWTIRTVPDFDREVKRLAKKYKSLRSDLSQFQKDITENPYLGTEILPGVRKISELYLIQLNCHHRFLHVSLFLQ